jgi:hypothetical protein
MEALKENIAVNEGLKLWLEKNLVRRKKWFDSCKENIKDLDRQIVRDKKKLAKLSEASIVPQINLQTTK